MASKFNENAIINGFIDYFCLVCETYFGTEEAAEKHMEKQIHIKNLGNSVYLEKYKSDCVRKVKAGYFCEFCNVLLSTGTKVNLHVEEKSHQDNKGIALLKYVDEGVVAYNEVVIKEEAWHGFTGDTCALCNCDVDDFANHKTDHSHILQLVQGKINFGPGNNLHRNVDESAFQCLTCNKILALSSFEKHISGSEHQQNYASCINNKTEHPHINSPEKHDNSYSTAEDNGTRSPSPPSADEFLDDNCSANILDCISEFQNNDINIHFESENAFCKKCYIAVAFDYNEIKKHIKEHKNKDTSSLSSPPKVEKNRTVETNSVKDSSTGELTKDLKWFTFSTNKVTEGNADEGEPARGSTPIPRNVPDSVISLEKFADGNKISYIAGNTGAHCTVCNVKLPATLRDMLQHVNESTHKNNMAPPKKPKCSGAHLQKVPMNTFMKEVIHIENVCGHDVVINESYCITAMSFLMILEEAEKLRCLYCEVSFDEINIKEHLRTASHNGAIDIVPFVVRADDEFVREIRSGIYHCGYCHEVVGDWLCFEEHVGCEGHLQKKKTMQYRLKAHQPAVMDHRREQQMRVMSRISLNRFGVLCCVTLSAA